MKKEKFKILRDYKVCSKPNLVSRANNVCGKMSDNPTFVNPPISMPDLKNAVYNLEKTMVDAAHRDQLKASLKNEAADSLIGMLDKLADWVTVIAKANESLLLSSGFKISTSKSANNSIGPVENFTVTIGPASGQVTMSVSPVDDGDSYGFYWGIDNGENTIWQSEVDTKSNFTVSNLQPGKPYAFMVKVAGSRRRKCQSEIIRKWMS